MKGKHGEVRGKVGILNMDIYQEKVVFLNINAWRSYALFSKKTQHCQDGRSS